MAAIATMKPAKASLGDNASSNTRKHLPLKVWSLDQQH